MGQKYAAFDADSGAITAFYDSVDSPVPTGLATVELSVEEWQSCLNAPGSGYTVNNGALVAPSSPSATQLLAQSRTVQGSALNAACQAAIGSGYASLALGSLHNYASQPHDQRNLSDAMSASLAPNINAGWTTLLWCRPSGGQWALVAHTGAQVQGVHSDWLAFRQSQQQKLATLTAQVNNAESAEAVEAIAWT